MRKIATTMCISSAFDLFVGRNGGQEESRQRRDNRCNLNDTDGLTDAGLCDAPAEPEEEHHSLDVEHISNKYSLNPSKFDALGLRIL